MLARLAYDKALQAQQGTGIQRLEPPPDGPSQQLNVNLLLSVKDLVSEASPSWLSREDVSQYFDYYVFYTHDISVIKSYREHARNHFDAIEWLIDHGYRVTFEDVNATFVARGGSTNLVYGGRHPLHSQIAANNNYIGSNKIDAKGNFVREFNFPMDYTFERETENLAFLVVPCFNIAGFMASKPEYPAIGQLSAAQRHQYYNNFIGSVTMEVVVENSQTPQKTDVYTYTHALPSGKQEERVWTGPVHYHGDNAGVLDARSTGQGIIAGTPPGYIGWMGGFAHDPGLTDEEAAREQPELRVKAVPNNKIQDFRALDRVQHLFTDLSPLDVKEFDPEIKSPNNRQKTDLVDSYFGEVELTTDLNKNVSLFTVFDVESFIVRETLFGSLWNNLSDEEKELMFSYVKFEQVQLRRRHVQAATTYNKMGGLGTDIPKIDEGDYEVADTVLLDENMPAGVASLNGTQGGSFRDVTGFLQNEGKSSQIRATRTLGKTKFFTFQDRTSSNLGYGNYQYIIKLSILDKTPEFLKTRRRELTQHLTFLTRYYDALMKPRAYNTRLDKIDLRNAAGSYAVSTGAYVIQGGIADSDSLLVRTLKMFSADPEAFDAEVVTNTLTSFLEPESATRDTVFKVIQVYNDLLDKIGDLLGTSAIPQTDMPSTAPTNPGSRNNKIIEIEQKAVSLFNAGYPQSTGYYYMPPLFADEDQLLGIRKISYQDLAAARRVEHHKSFRPGVNNYLIDDRPEVGFENDNPHRVIAHLEDFSYFTPLYAVVPSSKARFDLGVLRKLPLQPELLANTRIDASNVDGSVRKPFATPDGVALDVAGLGVEFLIHSPIWVPGGGRQWLSSTSKYNLITDMIRTLNLAKDVQAIAPSPDFIITGRTAGERREQAGLQSQSTLSKILSYQGCTIIAPGSAGGLVIDPGQHLPEPIAALAATPANFMSAFSPSIVSAGQAQIPRLRVAGTVRTKSLDFFAHAQAMADIARDLPDRASEDVIQDYLNGFPSLAPGEPRPVMRTILEGEKKQLNPTTFSEMIADQRGASYQALHQVALPMPLQALANIYVDATGLPTDSPAEPAITLPQATSTDEAAFFDFQFNMIMELQILEGFEDGANGRKLVDRPIWRKVVKSDLNANSVCRLVPYSNGELNTAAPPYLDMPVFDSVFMVEAKREGDL